MHAVHAQRERRHVSCLPSPSLVLIHDTRYSRSVHDGGCDGRLIAFELAGRLDTHSLWAAAALALTITLLVCASRVYLGMHCVADVVAGQSVCAVSVVFCRCTAAVLTVDGHVCVRCPLQVSCWQYAAHRVADVGGRAFDDWLLHGHAVPLSPGCNVSAGVRAPSACGSMSLFRRQRVLYRYAATRSVESPSPP